MDSHFSQRASLVRGRREMKVAIRTGAAVKADITHPEDSTRGTADVAAVKLLILVQ